jgi:hypothetical protein
LEGLILGRGRIFRLKIWTKKRVEKVWGIHICRLLVAIIQAQKTASADRFFSDQLCAETKALNEHGYHDELGHTRSTAPDRSHFDSSGFETVERLCRSGSFVGNRVESLYGSYG